MRIVESATARMPAQPRDAAEVGVHAFDAKPKNRALAQGAERFLRLRLDGQDRPVAVGRMRHSSAAVDEPDILVGIATVDVIRNLADIARDHTVSAYVTGVSFTVSAAPSGGVFSAAESPCRAAADRMTSSGNRGSAITGK